MSLNITVTRIPITFVFPAAPGMVPGQVQSLVLGGVGAVTTSVVSAAASLIPGLGGSVAASRALLVGITTGKLISLPMLVNPNSMSINKNPQVNKTLTKRGVLTQFWQAEPDLINFSGRAAGKRAFLLLTQIDQLMQTMESGTRNVTTLIYKYGGVYQGYFLNFKIAATAEQPGIFDYSFDFQFTDTKHMRLFLMAISTSTLNAAIDNPGKFIVDTIKMGKDELASTAGVSLGKVR